MTKSTGAKPKANPTTTKSWRDLIRVHPAAEMFPLMSPEELKALGENIRANGLRVPIVTWFDKGGQEWLIDGRNRLDALALSNFCLFQRGKPSGVSRKVLPEQFKIVSFPNGGRRENSGGLQHWYEGENFNDNQHTIGDPRDFVIALNIERRHLTVEQRRELTAKLLKADPDRSNRAIGEQVKLDKNTVQDVRQGLEARGEIHHVETRVDTKGRKQPAKKSAAKAAEAPAASISSVGSEPQGAPRSAPTASSEPVDWPEGNGVELKIDAVLRVLKLATFEHASETIMAWFDTLTIAQKSQLIEMMEASATAPQVEPTPAAAKPPTQPDPGSRRER